MVDNRPMESIRIATRGSLLALWQARHVAARLEELHAGLRADLVTVRTQGDVWLSTPLAEVGGKGLFVERLERTMQEGGADIAVHSMKDVPVELAEGFDLPVLCAREDPRDALVSADSARLDALPRGAVVGTSSLRRRCQVSRAAPGPRRPGPARQRGHAPSPSRCRRFRCRRPRRRRAPSPRAGGSDRRTPGPRTLRSRRRSGG